MDNRFRQHKTLYIGWNELDQVMQEIMDDSTYEVNRVDYCWIDGYSEHHDTDYDDEDILNRLSNYLDVKIFSYHADEHGVWFVIE